MPATHPEYVTTATEAGADVNYECPCGCYAGFAYARGVDDPVPESCCCGRTMFVGDNATGRLREFLTGAGAFELDEQVIVMPWGSALGVALATPADAEHGAHAATDDEHGSHEHEQVR